MVRLSDDGPIDEQQLRHDRAAHHLDMVVQQLSLTLSSVRAELCGIVKAAGAGLRHQSIMRDFGLDVLACFWPGSSAAFGITLRSG